MTRLSQTTLGAVKQLVDPCMDNSTCIIQTMWLLVQSKVQMQCWFWISLWRLYKPDTYYVLVSPYGILVQMRFIYRTKNPRESLVKLSDAFEKDYARYTFGSLFIANNKISIVSLLNSLVNEHTRNRYRKTKKADRKKKKKWNTFLTGPLSPWYADVSKNKLARSTDNVRRNGFLFFYPHLSNVMVSIEPGNKPELGFTSATEQISYRRENNLVVLNSLALQNNVSSILKLV